MTKFQLAKTCIGFVIDQYCRSLGMPPVVQHLPQNPSSTQLFKNTP